MINATGRILNGLFFIVNKKRKVTNFLGLNHHNCAISEQNKGVPVLKMGFNPAQCQNIPPSVFPKQLIVFTV